MTTRKATYTWYLVKVLVVLRENDQCEMKLPLFMSFTRDVLSLPVKDAICPVSLFCIEGSEYVQIYSKKSNKTLNNMMSVEVEQC